jgi:putative membrane protein
MEFQIVMSNLIYTIAGTLLALFFMVCGYKLFDFITPFDTNAQIEKGNIAVGIIVGSIFLSLGISMGIVIGMGLN